MKIFLNKMHLFSIADNNRFLMVQIIDAYLISHDELIQKIQLCILNEKYDEGKKATHALRGALSVLDQSELISKLKKLESQFNILKNNELNNIFSVLKKELNTLEKEILDFKSEINKAV